MVLVFLAEHSFQHHFDVVLLTASLPPDEWVAVELLAEFFDDLVVRSLSSAFKWYFHNQYYNLINDSPACLRPLLHSTVPAPIKATPIKSFAKVFIFSDFDFVIMIYYFLGRYLSISLSSSLPAFSPAVRATENQGPRYFFTGLKSINGFNNLLLSSFIVIILIFI